MPRERNSNKEFHQQAVGVWQPRTSSPLSSEAVREMTENITGFFETLLKWDEADRRALGSSDISGQTEAGDDQTPTP